MNEGTDICEDIDECRQGTYCDKNSICTNSPGEFNCTCNSGFFGDGLTCTKGDCSDDACGLNEECISPTNPSCRCKTGFKRIFWESYGTEICRDIDECVTTDICDKEAECVNTHGSYECNCLEGNFGNGKTCFQGSCSDSNCPPKDNMKCLSPRKISCECVEGFEMKNGVCSVIDECLAGYTKVEGSSNCTDLDECTNGSHDCHTDAECGNSVGSFTCTCQTGFSGNGTLCTEISRNSSDSL